MMRVHRKKVYPTRESELPRILRVRMKGLRAIIGTNDAYNLSFELTTLEYVMLIIMYECGMNSLITYLDLVVKHGPFYIGGAYIFIMVTLTMPIYMLLTFLGSYSKKSYIKLFTCAPIFEGLGYMVGSVKLMGELFNSSMAATALLTFYHCLAGQFKANFCEGLILKNGNDLRCLSKYPRFLYHIPCQKEADTRFLTTTQYYFIKLLNHSYDETTPPKLNNNLVVSSFLIWTLIFAMALGGIKRLKTLTTNLQFVCGFVVILTVLVAISHAHPRFEIRARSFGEISCLFSFEVSIISVVDNF
nr:uncharacterized protein LOC111415402 [Onthophagus taurus]